jgi:hypothetical protein
VHGVQESHVAGEKADVEDMARRFSKEDEVAEAQRLAGDRGAAAELAFRGAGKRDADLGVGVLRQAGRVEAGRCTISTRDGQKKLEIRPLSRSRLLV